MFIGHGQFGFTVLRGYRTGRVVGMSLSFQDSYGHVQGGNTVPYAGGALSVSEGKQYTGNPFLIRQNKKHGEARIENGVGKVKESKNSKNMDIVKTSRTTSLIKVVQEELVKRTESLYLDVLRDVQTTVEKHVSRLDAQKETTKGHNERSENQDVSALGSSQLNGSEGTQNINTSAASIKEIKSEEEALQSELKKGLLGGSSEDVNEVGSAGDALSSEASDASGVVKLITDLIKHARNEKVKDIIKSKSGQIADTGDPIEDLQNISFSKGTKDDFRDLIKKQITRIFDPDIERSSNDPSLNSIDLKKIIHDAIRDAVKKIPDERLDPIIGQLQLQDEITKGSKAPLHLIPNLSLLAITKKLDEFEINQISTVLLNKGNEKVPKIDESQIKDVIADLVSRGLPRSENVNDFVLSTFEKVKKGSQNDQVTAHSLHLEIKDTLDQVIKFLQLPEPILHSESLKKDSNEVDDVPIVTDLSENEALGPDKKQKEDPILKVGDKKLLQQLTPLRNALGLDHPDLLVLAQVLRPFINAHVTIDTGEATPTLSIQEEEANVTKTKGPLHTMNHEGLTDSSLVFVAYWNYQGIKIQETVRLSEQVPKYQAKEGKSYSEQDRDADVANTLRIVSDIKYSQDTDPKTIEDGKMSLPPLYERDSIKQKQQFAEPPPKGEPSPKPNSPTSHKSTDSTLWP